MGFSTIIEQSFDIRTAGRRLVAGLLAASIAACGGSGDDDGAAPPAAVVPVITAQPTAQTVLTGATAAFSVTATGNGLAYQWKKNGTDIAGATAAAYTTPPVGYADSGAAFTVAVAGAGGTVTSAPAVLSLMASAGQQAFESLIRSAGGSHFFRWNLNYSGPETVGTNFAYSESSTLALSPLTAGPQTTTQSPPATLATTLPIVAPTPGRILKNGALLLVPTFASSTTASYVGNDVRIDSLASDNATVAYSQLRSDFTVVPLTGTMASTPADFAHWHNSFFSNPAILNPAAAYLAGASYVRFTATNIGDRYQALDCAAATAGVTPSPCATGTTLAAALTGGLNADGITFTLADGVQSTVGGVPVWVANAPRSAAAALTDAVQYRFFFQLNDNVYTGALTRDGAVLPGSYWVSHPGGATIVDRLSFLPFQIRMNKAARDSIAAAMQI